MKRTILTLSFIFCATTADAYSTTKEAAFCVSEDLFTQMSAAIAAEDEATLIGLYKSQSCGRLPAGMKLSIKPDGLQDSGPWRVEVHLPSGERAEVWIAQDGVNILK